MYNISKFKSVDGKPDETEVENWVETYFSSLMNIFNGFFCHVDLDDALSRMSEIPFEQLVKEQLDGESEEVIEIATAKVRELAEAELEYIKAYIE